jgi:excisionase family DNA binding protein
MASETSLSDVRFLTVAKVALIMRVSKIVVYRLVHSGELEAIRVRRSFRIPEAAVNQYLRYVDNTPVSHLSSGWRGSGSSRIGGSRAARSIWIPS